MEPSNDDSTVAPATTTTNTGASPVGVQDANNDDASSSLDNPSLYISTDEWFNGIQEEVLDFTAGTSKRKKVLLAGDKLYLGNKFYDMVAKLYDIYVKRSDIQMKNKSLKVKRMGGWIYNGRKLYSRSDVHSIVDVESRVWIQQNTDTNVDKFYVYPQRDFLRKVLNEYSLVSITKGKPTPNDYCRLISLIFSHKFREKIPLLFTPKHNMSRLDIDSRTSEVRTLWRDIYLTFHDKEEIMQFPDGWNTADVISNIEDHQKYTPNDLDRIRLPRTEKALKSMKTELFLEYNKLLERYKSDTGGGSGNPARIGNWKDRDPLSIRDPHYMGGTSSDYLTFMFFFDKQYSFPLVEEKGPLPAGCTIDDDGYSSAITDSSMAQGRMTPTFGINRYLSQELNSMSAQSEERNKMFSEMGQQLVNAVQSPQVQTTQSRTSNNHNTLGEVVSKRKEVSTSELEWAHGKLSENIVDNNEKLTFTCSQISQCQKTADECKAKHDKPKYIISKKRKRKYEKERDITEGERERYFRMLELINLEMNSRTSLSAGKNGESDTNIDKVDSDDNVSMSSFDE